jgi:hypothetical protein
LSAAVFSAGDQRHLAGAVLQFVFAGCCKPLHAGRGRTRASGTEYYRQSKRHRFLSRLGAALFERKPGWRAWNQRRRRGPGRFCDEWRDGRIRRAHGHSSRPGVHRRDSHALFEIPKEPYRLIPRTLKVPRPSENRSARPPSDTALACSE